MIVGRIRIPEKFEPLLHHFKARGPTIGGISGGRTSALMHVLSLAANPSDDDYKGVFANTGKEHDGTYLFLKRLEEATGRTITWVEFRPPERLGMEPKFSRYAVVNFETANRTGRPFEDFLETLAAYRREVKGLGPAVPGVVSRLCTNYMKIRRMHQWSVEQVGPDYCKFVGLRADEPHRVARLKSDASTVETLAPLAIAGLTKADVLEFWSMQDFDLEIPEHLGNCNKCYLKDEADIAQSMYDESWDVDWWLGLQDRYGDFRNGGTTMRTIWSEARPRLEIIRPAVLRDEVPPCPENFSADATWLTTSLTTAQAAHDERMAKYEAAMSEWKDGGQAGPEPRKPRPPAALSRTAREWAEYRWTLLVRQEQQRKKNGPASFSCACESSQMDLE